MTRGIVTKITKISTPRKLPAIRYIKKCAFAKLITLNANEFFNFIFNGTYVNTMLHLYVIGYEKRITLRKNLILSLQQHIKVQSLASCCNLFHLTS